LILFGVEDAKSRNEEVARPRLRLSEVNRFRAAFWVVVGISAVLTLARFSEAFLLLRSQNAGLPTVFVPAVLVVMNVFYALSAYPAGVLSDRVGRTEVLAIGIAFLAVADLILALGGTIPLVMSGVAFWGLHMGFTQGLLATLVADTAPAKLRGTAFGVFNLAAGVAILIASVLAGALWDLYGPAATFLAGAVFTVLAFVGFVIVQRRAATAATLSRKARIARNGENERS
jgi:MFS family permease